MAWVEQTEKRSQKAKHFFDSATGQYQAVFGIHDLHYKDGAGNWQDVDEAIYDDTSVSGFVASALKTRHGVRFGSGGERRWYPRINVPGEYVEVGKPDYWATNRWRVWNLTGLSRTGNRVSWDTSTYNVTITNLWRRVKLSYTLKTTAAYTRVRYPLTLSGLTLNETTGALTSQSDGVVVGWIDKPTAEDANGNPVTVSQTIASGYVELVVTPGSATYPIVVDPTLTDGQGAAGSPETNKDTQVNGIAGGTPLNVERNYGAATTFSLLTTVKSLYEFDCSSITAGATCTSATLSLYQAASGAASAFTLTCYSIASGNAAWIEGTGTGGAAQANAGEPCWEALAADGSGGVTTAWAGSAGLATSGTDYEASALGTADGNRSDANGTEYQLSLTTSRIDDWFGAGTYNYGLLVLTSASGGALGSSDHLTTGYRPKLVVVYTTGGSFSPSISPSASPSQSPSVSQSPSASVSLSPSVSISPSASPSQSPSVSVSPSASPSQSPSVSVSPSLSPSRSPSKSPSVSPSISPSKSPSVSPSQSPSVSASPSASPSLSPSQSPSVSLSPSQSPSASPSISPSVSPSAPTGTVVWGHLTGATEDNQRTFADNWTGTAAISGAGDAEKVELSPGEYLESEVVNTGLQTVKLLQNQYQAGDTVLIRYRTGATVEACQAAEYADYTIPFASAGFVQVRLESTL